MTTIYTCAQNAHQSKFDYTGSVASGVNVRHKTTNYNVHSDIFRDVMEHFSGQVVPGGFSKTDPTPGGVGEYLNKKYAGLTSRHASFLCAILRHEGYVQCGMKGNAVMVIFQKILRCTP